MALKPLATVEQYKRFNRVQENSPVGSASKNFTGNNNAETDDEILLYLNAASATIRNYACRDFTLTKYKEMQFGSVSGRYTTLEPIYDLISFNSAGYDVDKSSCQVLGSMIVSNYIMSGINVVEYVGGFSEVPADIVQATVYLASVLSRKKTRIGEQSVTNGDSTTVFQSVELPEDIKLVLEDYREWWTDGASIISREDYNG